MTNLVPQTYTLIRDAGSFRIRWTYTIEALREQDARETVKRIALEENCKILAFGPEGKFLFAYQPHTTAVEKS